MRASLTMRGKLILEGRRGREREGGKGERACGAPFSFWRGKEGERERGESGKEKERGKEKRGGGRKGRREKVGEERGGKGGDGRKREEEGGREGLFCLYSRSLLQEKGRGKEEKREGRKEREREGEGRRGGERGGERGGALRELERRHFAVGERTGSTETGSKVLCDALLFLTLSVVEEE